MTLSEFVTIFEPKLENKYRGYRNRMQKLEEQRYIRYIRLKDMILAENNTVHRGF